MLMTPRGIRLTAVGGEPWRFHGVSTHLVCACQHPAYSLGFGLRRLESLATTEIELDASH